MYKLGDIIKYHPWMKDAGSVDINTILKGTIVALPYIEEKEPIYCVNPLNSSKYDIFGVSNVRIIGIDTIATLKSFKR
jgi:hypothetical protein